MYYSPDVRLSLNLFSTLASALTALVYDAVLQFRLEVRVLPSSRITFLIISAR